MLNILSGSQMRDIDKKAIENLNIPGIILMENAGRAVAEVVIDVLEDLQDEEPNVLIICGKGNNGGDGFVAARHLIENNILTAVISINREEDLSGDALINHNILKHFTDIIYLYDIGTDELKNMISVSTVVVDAILGTGVSSEIHGKVKEIIETINEYSESYVISVDIPSGIDANTGKIMGTAVVADYTVTFFRPKIGNILYPGSEHNGEIIVADIGIPNFLDDEPEYNINLITAHQACILLPFRQENSHKGTFGKVFNLAGSCNLPGAAYMCSISSLKVGAGYSVLATPESLIPTFAGLAPELIYIPLKETEKGIISNDSLEYALDQSLNYDCYLIGPGIGTHLSTVEFVNGFLKELTDRGLNTIIDADGLNCLAIKEDFTLPLSSIVTPHPKELSRLLKIPTEEILEDLIKYASLAAEKFQTIVVLKSARTIIAEPNGNMYINTSGNSALATAGTGDVLSGIIAGLVALKLDLLSAAILGVYLHGMAGEITADAHTEYSTTATDLINYIPEAIKKII